MQPWDRGLRQLVTWLWKSANLDLTIPLLVALSAAVLTLLDKVPVSVTTAVTLASLAAISLALMGLREATFARTNVNPCLQMQRPPEFQEYVNDRDYAVLIIGVSLNRTLIASTTALAAPGRSIRIMLSDPADAVVSSAIARRRSVRATPELVSADIQGGIDLAQAIRSRTPGPDSSVALRISSQVLCAGITVFTHKRDQSKNRILWEVYQVQGDTARQPVAWLAPGEPTYDSILEEAEKLWASAVAR